MPVLGESEKARLQRIFEWGNVRIPESNKWRDNERADTEEAQLVRKRLQGQGANAQREKNNKTNEGNPGGLSSHSKRLLEHNLNTSTEKPAANHRRYKQPHSTPNFSSFLPPKGFNGVKLVGQSKENHHHHHHHDQENHHHHKENHRHHVDKRQERDLKTSRHHRTSCRSESELKTKSKSRP